MIEPGLLVRRFSRPAIVDTTVLSVLGAFTWQARASFLSTFLEQHRGLSRTTADHLFSTYVFIYGGSRR